MKTAVCCCSRNTVEVAAVVVGLLSHELQRAAMQQTIVFTQSSGIQIRYKPIA
jgi:hypothetical protein